MIIASGIVLDTLDHSAQYGPLIVKRRASPVKDQYGNFVEHAPTTIEVSPYIVHPASAEDLLLVPEAYRGSETINVNCRTLMYAEKVGFAPDEIEYKSKTFRVVSVSDYQNISGSVFVLASVPSQ